LTPGGVVYPRLADGIMIVPVDEGCIVEGGPQRELFTGKAARILFPKLLPLLDGTRQTAEVATDLGISSENAWRVLRVLIQRGLVHLCSRPAGSHDRVTPMDTYLWRSLPGGRGPAVAERIRRARVSVIGRTHLADLLADSLVHSGVGTVTRQEDTPLTAANDVRADVTIWTGTTLPESDARPVLPILMHPARISIGPFLGLAEGPCRHCVTTSDHEQACDRSPWPTDDLVLAGLGAGIAAGAALRYLGGYGASPAWQGIIDVWPDGRQAERSVEWLGECTACAYRSSLTVRDLDELDNERSASPPQWGGEMHPMSSAHPADATSIREYLTEPRLKVRGRAGSTRRAGSGSAPAAGSHAGTDESQGELLAALTWQLSRSVGRPRTRGRGDLRPAYAMSGTAPGAIHAYAIGDLSGKKNAVHYFDGTTREFVVLPDLAGPSNRPAPDSLSVALVGDLIRARLVLGRSARRALYQDAGLAAAQLDACARACGWRVESRAGHAEDVLSRLALDPEREVAGAVLDLTPVQPGAGSATKRKLLSACLRRPLTYSFSGDPVSTELLRRLAATSLERVASIWRRGDHQGLPVDCVIYARRTDGPPRGLYALGRGQDLVPARMAAGTEHVEAYLRDRSLDPPALLMFTGDLPAALSQRGAPGYPAVLAAAGAAAGAARLAALAAGLGTGLISRPPAICVARTASDGQDRHIVLCGCAVGLPARSAETEGQGGIPWLGPPKRSPPR
jgi:hypothetical protein